MVFFPDIPLWVFVLWVLWAGSILFLFERWLNEPLDRDAVVDRFIREHPEEAKRIMDEIRQDGQSKEVK